MAQRFAQTMRALDADNVRRSAGLWALSGVAIACWTAWMLFGRVVVYETSGRARLEVQQAPHHLAALSPSRVAASHLALGRTVEAGEVLVLLESTSEALRLKEEEAKLAVLPRRIASLRKEEEARRSEREEDLEASRAAVAASTHRLREADLATEFARENERRIARLNAMGSATLVEAQRTATEAQKLAAARDGLAADIKRIEREASMRAAQRNAQIEAIENTIVQLQGEIETTEATARRLREDIEKLSIRSPIAGRIGDVVPLHAGAYVAQGQRLATVVPPGDLIAVADFSPTTSLGRVRAGQRARLRLDSYPWSQYGVVEAIVSSVASEIRDGFVHAEFRITSKPATGIVLQHGLPGSVEVAVETLSPAALAVRAAGFLLPHRPAPRAPPRHDRRRAPRPPLAGARDGADLSDGLRPGGAEDAARGL